MIHFIINPVAGHNRGSLVIKQIDACMEGKEIPYRLHISEYSGHVKELVARALLDNPTAIVAVGGDGTVNEVAKELVHQSVPMGILPCGTGNDLVKTLNIPKDVSKCIEIINANHILTVDVGDASGSFFLNAAGIGFDANVAAATGRFKEHLTGKMAYLAGIFSSLIHLECPEMDVVIDESLETERTLSKQFLLIAVANGRMIGGGMPVAPKAVMDDTLFDVCLVNSVTRLQIMGLLAKFLKGNHIYEDCCEYIRAKSVRVKSKKALNLQIDGEIMQTDRVSFTIQPSALRILVP